MSLQLHPSLFTVHNSKAKYESIKSWHGWFPTARSFTQKSKTRSKNWCLGGWGLFYCSTFSKVKVPKCSWESRLYFIPICSIRILFRFEDKIKFRYPYFPAVDDNLALSHIAALLGSAGLRDAAASMGRKLTTANLPEANLSVQQFVRKQRLSSTQATKDGNLIYQNEA